MTTGYEEVAAAIIAGQAKVMGPVATTLASKVSGMSISSDGGVTISGDGGAAIGSLVQEFSSVTGKLGVRMCFQAAQPVLASHPDVQIPVFASL